MDEQVKVLKTVYAVSDFLDWQKSEALELRPYFQRNSVWSVRTKSYLIDTLLRGYPIPVVLLQTDRDPKSLKSIRRVVDGQQRLRTLLAFIDPSSLSDFGVSDEFTIMRTHNRELAGAGFKDLDRSLQDRLLNTELSVHVLDRSVRNERVLELFARMNSTAKSLNEQEKRNALFHGDFKQTAYDLAYSNFSRWQAWKSFSLVQVAEMKEVEFTSELLLYTLNGLTAKSKTALDRVYSDNDTDWVQSVAAQKRVGHVLDVIDGAFDKVSPAVVNRFAKQGWLYILFALIHDGEYASYLPFAGEQEGRPTGGTKLAPSRLPGVLESAHQRLAGDSLPDALVAATRGASTDRGSRETRYAFLRSLVVD